MKRGDVSEAKVLLVQLWGPKFVSLEPKWKQPWSHTSVIPVLNGDLESCGHTHLWSQSPVVTWEAGIGESPEAHGCLGWLTCTTANNKEILYIKWDVSQRPTQEVLWPLHTCPRPYATHIHIHKCTPIHYAYRQRKRERRKQTELFKRKEMG